LGTFLETIYSLTLWGLIELYKCKLQKPKKKYFKFMDTYGSLRKKEEITQLIKAKSS